MDTSGAEYVAALSLAKFVVAIKEGSTALKRA